MLKFPSKKQVIIEKKLLLTNPSCVLNCEFYFSGRSETNSLNQTIVSYSFNYPGNNSKKPLVGNIFQIIRNSAFSMLKKMDILSAVSPSQHGQCLSQVLQKTELMSTLLGTTKGFLTLLHSRLSSMVSASKKSN